MEVSRNGVSGQFRTALLHAVQVSLVQHQGQGAARTQYPRMAVEIAPAIDLRLKPDHATFPPVQVSVHHMAL